MMPTVITPNGERLTVSDPKLAEHLAARPGWGLEKEAEKPKAKPTRKRKKE